MMIMKIILYVMYNVQLLKIRLREHISSLMYRQSKQEQNVEYNRPTINLCSNKKVRKFKDNSKRNYQMFLQWSDV